MRYTFVTKFWKPLQQLFADLSPVQIGVCLDMVLKGAALAELCDDVAVVGRVVDVLKLQQIGMRELFKHLDLIMQEFTFCGI